MEKSFRIKANIGKESVVHVPIKQDVDMLEMLSVQLGTDGIYKRHSSNYGVIIGRVVVNGGLGVPNAKISVFVPLSSPDALRPEIKSLYPYKSVNDVDSDGRRYNLLPMRYDDDEHVAVGTFPTQQEVLDNDIYLEIYEKYYKYTTVTNESGDYMLYGVPVGSQTMHMDVDISDIGYLSQKPYHLIDKGYAANMFDSPTKFKGGNSLDLLPQIFTENESIHVYPFWGDEETDEIAITRKDFELSYTISPTCVVMGSVVTDSDQNYISEGCTISEKLGEMSQLQPSAGKIEMMRVTPSGDFEEYVIKDTNLIDENGVFCFQVPMNLNYVTTAEDGKLVRSEDPKNGIPTTARVRFRVSLEGESEDVAASHTMAYLIPSNPESQPIGGNVDSTKYEKVVDIYSTFGNDFGINEEESAETEMRDDCFRDVLWNCVYTVKSYIPRVELTNVDDGSYAMGNSSEHIGIKGVNKSGAEGKTPFPYNKMNLSIPFITWNINQSLRTLFEYEFYDVFGFTLLSRFFKFFKRLRFFFNNAKTYESIQNEDEQFARNIEDTDGVSFDFYNDWVNGCLYFPRVKYAVDYEFCDCKQKPFLGEYANSKYVVNDTCSLDYYYGKVDGYGEPISTAIREAKEKRMVDFGEFDKDNKTNFLLTTGTTRDCIKKCIFDQNEYEGHTWREMSMDQQNDDAPNTFIYRTAEKPLTNGLTLKKVSKVDNNNIQFSYSPLFYNRDKRETYNGFKTDLILLGAIDSRNFHGIPTVKSLRLPRTTATLMHMYRSDASGKNYTGEYSGGPYTWDEGGGYKPIDERAIANEGIIEGEDMKEQGVDVKSGEDVSDLIRSAKNAQSMLHRTNGAFWGSSEYSKINVDNRWVRFWKPWGVIGYLGPHKLYGFLSGINVESSKYFRARTGGNDWEYSDTADWDRGTHCLLGGGLFFGKTNFSAFNSEYVTKPKTCINLSRICELSVQNEDSLTYPDKKSRTGGGTTSDESNINIQFNFCNGVTGDQYPPVINNSSDENFFNTDYVMPDNKNGKWVLRPEKLKNDGKSIWITSRYIELDEKTTRLGLWCFNEPVLWGRWGYCAINSYEVEYVFLTTPELGPGEKPTMSTWYAYEGVRHDYIDDSGKKETDDGYCPRASYVYNNKQFTEKTQGQIIDFDTQPSEHYIQWVGIRTRDKKNGEWTEYHGGKMEKWNDREDSNREYEEINGFIDCEAYFYRATECHQLTYAHPFCSKDNISPTYFTPKNFLWKLKHTYCVEKGTYTNIFTIISNIYGVIGGRLTDKLSDDRINVRYINCGMRGVIGDEEITDYSSRSLFASLNSAKLTLPKNDEDKSYTVSRQYKGMMNMKIDGFDGFLNGMVLKDYYKDGQQSNRIKNTVIHKENGSHDYFRFRYGDDAKFNVIKTKGGNEVHQFPVFENSFYFYFGINPSQTALHKLKNDFLS